MTIPASSIVRVNPGVLSAGGNAVDLNGLILTQSASLPVGAVTPFPNPDAVADYFGASSTEYAMATIYFAGYSNATSSPGRLYFSSYPATDVSAWLRGGSLANQTLDQLKLLSGSLQLNVDGKTVQVENINLATATSFSNAAEALSAALKIPVIFEPTKSAFVLSAKAKGAVSSITVASGTLAEGLKLTSATGAVISLGSTAATPEDALLAVVARQQNWAAFTTTWEPTTLEKIGFSRWVNSTQYRYLYAGWDTDINATVASSTETWGYAVQQAKYEGSVLIYGDATHAAFVLGVTASLDFTRTDGRITYAFRRMGGLLESVSDATQAANLSDNGYNFYGNYATSNEEWNFFYPGTVSGIYKWIDAYVNQIWLNASLQSAMLRLLLSVGSVPYNAQGNSLIDAACAEPLNAAVDFGAIRTGITLSESQKEQIRNATGIDVSAVIAAKGYYLQIKPASAQIRAERKSPALTLYYADGGAIQQLNLASIEIE